MPPSLYSRMPTATQKKFVRYAVTVEIWMAISGLLYAVRKQHLALEMLMVLVMLGAIFYAVKFLRLITAAADELENDDGPGSRS